MENSEDGLRLVWPRLNPWEPEASEDRKDVADETTRTNKRPRDWEKKSDEGDSCKRQRYATFSNRTDPDSSPTESTDSEDEEERHVTVGGQTQTEGDHKMKEALGALDLLGKCIHSMKDGNTAEIQDLQKQLREQSTKERTVAIRALLYKPRLERSQKNWRELCESSCRAYDSYRKTQRDYDALRSEHSAQLLLAEDTTRLRGAYQEA